LINWIWSDLGLFGEMAGMPISGKLSGMYGRKRFFILELLCLWEVQLLCVLYIDTFWYRTIQGIGGVL